VKSQACSLYNAAHQRLFAVQTAGICYFGDDALGGSGVSFAIKAWMPRRRVSAR
jgi:hypothetical protein